VARRAPIAVWGGVPGGPQLDEQESRHPGYHIAENAPTEGPAALRNGGLEPAGTPVTPYARDDGAVSSLDGRS
jgi:hypothetical protein